MIGPNSRYGVIDNPLKYVDVNTQERWLGVRDPLVLAPAADDHFLVLRDGERPDQVAARVPGWQQAFGDEASTLFWVIADQPDNELLNPFQLPAGRRVRCPSADRVASALGR